MYRLDVNRSLSPLRIRRQHHVSFGILPLSPSDVRDETIELTDNALKFKGKSGEKDYEVDVEFFESVDSEGSTYKVLPRSVQMHIMKKKGEDDADAEFWPRLLQDKAKEKNQVKVDWDRYVDEDEEDEAGGFDMSALQGGMGMGGGMPGMGGMGGMGGMPGMEGMEGMPGMGGMDMQKLVSQRFAVSLGFCGLVGRMDELFSADHRVGASLTHSLTHVCIVTLGTCILQHLIGIA